jgi:hypothetical protein
MQHSNYQTTSKHYIDRKEIAKDMVKQGFRVFPENNTVINPLCDKSAKIYLS